jgi:hypothetical protein
MSTRSTSPKQVETASELFILIILAATIQKIETMRTIARVSSHVVSVVTGSVAVVSNIFSIAGRRRTPTLLDVRGHERQVSRDTPPE